MQLWLDSPANGWRKRRSMVVEPQTEKKTKTRLYEQKILMEMRLKIRSTQNYFAPSRARQSPRISIRQRRWKWKLNHNLKRFEPWQNPSSDRTSQTDRKLKMKYTLSRRFLPFTTWPLNSRINWSSWCSRSKLEVVKSPGGWCCPSTPQMRTWFTLFSRGEGSRCHSDRFGFETWWIERTWWTFADKLLWSSSPLHWMVRKPKRGSFWSCF